MVVSEFNHEAGAIVANAQALSRALGRGSADRDVALDDLEQAGKEWVSRTSAIRGFDSDPAEGPDSAVPAEALLGAVEADLEVAAVLLAAGVTVQEIEVDVDSHRLLQSSVYKLEEHLAREDGSGITSGFAPENADADSASLVESAGAALESVIQGTLGILKDAWTRLSDLLPDAVAKAGQAFDSILEAAPQIGRLVRLGLQALKRALLALGDLLPEAVRNTARTLGREWWTKNASGVQREAVARLVGEHQVKDLLNGIDESRVDQAVADRAKNQLVLLVDRYKGLAASYSNILGALAAAVAVATLIAAVVTAIAAWVPVAAAVGYLLVAGSIVVFGRDYLDTGDLLARVAGIQRIVTIATERK